MAKEPKKLDELFHDTLKDIYFAEKKILSTLPKMVKAAQSEELKAAFEKHYTETEGQIERLEKVFSSRRTAGQDLCSYRRYHGRRCRDYGRVQRVARFGRWSSRRRTGGRTL